MAKAIENLVFIETRLGRRLDYQDDGMIELSNRVSIKNKKITEVCYSNTRIVNGNIREDSIDRFDLKAFSFSFHKDPLRSTQ